MADIARLGFAVDTDDLTVAEQKLRKLAPAAKSAEDAAKKTTSAFTGLGAAAGSTQRGTNAIINSMNRGSSGAANFSKSAMMASASTRALGVATAGADAMMTKFGNTSKLTADKLNMVSVAADRATLTAGQLQANSTNLISQFQDIGVTASMGMSPLLIGFQQGAQIALVMQQAIGAQGLAGGLRALGASFLAVLGPVTFLSIALTAGIAALIQFIDWTSVAQTTLNFLADNMEIVALAAAALGTVMLVAFGPQIVAAIAALVVWIGTTLWAAIVKATVAMVAFAAANPWAAFILGISAAVAAAIYFADTIEQKFNVDIVNSVKKTINFVVGGMVGAYNTIRETWAQLPAAIGDAAIQAANRVIEATSGMITRVKKQLNELFILRNTETGETRRLFNFDTNTNLGQIANPFAGAANRVGGVARDQITRAQNTDWVGGAIETVKDLGADAAAYLKSLADGLGAETGKNDDSKGTDKAGAGRTKQDPWAELKADTEQRIATLKAESAALELVGEAAARAQYEQDLLNRAQQAGIKLTPLQTLTLKDYAKELATLDNFIESRRAALRQTRGIEESIANMQAEQQALGMTAEATARLLTEQQLLNDERFRGIVYTDEEKQRIIELAGAQAALNEQLERQRKNFELQRSTFKGLFEDMRSSLKQGEGFWSSLFGAIENGLNRILDRLFDLWLDQAFQSLIGNGGGGGGGIFGSIFSAIGLAAGSLTGGSTNNSGFGLKTGFKNAKGNAFGSSIINEPTMFGYGSNQMGQLGEAGPEAILPLRRGADGSLGVQMVGAANAATAQRVELVIYGEAGPLFVPTVRSISEDTAVKVTTAGIEQYNESLPDRVQEISNDPRVR